MSDGAIARGNLPVEWFGRLIPSDRAFLCGPLRGYRWLTGAAAGWAKGASIYVHNVKESIPLLKEYGYVATPLCGREDDSEYFFH